MIQHNNYNTMNNMNTSNMKDTDNEKFDIKNDQYIDHIDV